MVGYGEMASLPFTHGFTSVLADTSSFLNPYLHDFFKTAGFYNLHPTVYTEGQPGAPLREAGGLVPRAVAPQEFSSRPGSAVGTELSASWGLISEAQGRTDHPAGSLCLPPEIGTWPWHRSWRQL
jgi:hypothetical protein